MSVLGVDDFAFRKGHAYGTVLVDLERRRVLDLLPEHFQETLVAWLKRHPEVEIAARDRSNVYREALISGAPEATQVTDRWHLLHNLALNLEEFLLQKRHVRRDAAMPGTEPEGKGEDDFDSGPVMPNRPRTHERKIEEAAQKCHERLVEQWGNIRRLYLAGADLRYICKRLGVSPRTVYRYKDLAEPPPRPAYKRRAGRAAAALQLTIRVDGSSAGTRRITSVDLANYNYNSAQLQPGTYTIGLKGGNLA